MAVIFATSFLEWKLLYFDSNVSGMCSPRATWPCYFHFVILYTLRWRHNGLGSISNHQPHDCLLNRLFRRRSKKTSKIHVTGLCAVNSPAENVSIWRRHHGIRYLHINSLSPMRFSCYRKGIIFKLISGIDIMSISCEIVLKGMSQDFNITSGNDLVPSGNKSLPGPVLT